MTMAAFATLGMEHWMVGLIAVVIFAVNIVAAATILNKAGYSRWWCLLLLVPVVNIIVYWVFAFSRWPNLKPTLA